MIINKDEEKKEIIITADDPKGKFRGFSGVTGIQGMTVKKKVFVVPSFGVAVYGGWTGILGVTGTQGKTGICP